MGDPLVSLLMPVYRRQAFLEAALAAAFAQDYAPMEIVICDDASPDDAFTVLREIAQSHDGPHKLTLARNEHTLAMGNYNRLMELSAGELVVIAHHDDISAPHRVRRLVETWRATGASLISSNATVIDEAGAELKPRFCEPEGSGPVGLRDLAREGWRPQTLGATFAWTRDVFDRFGPIEVDRTAVASDHLLPFRAALLDGVYFLDEPLVSWRRHESQSSKRFIGAGVRSEAGFESVVAQDLIQIRYQLHELDRFRGSGAKARWKTRGVRNLLIARLEKRLEDWAMHRNRLLAAKKRPEWRDPS